QRLSQLDRDQKQTLVDLCLRRDLLRIATRARLFQVLSDYLKGRFDVAPTDYQSDERFILEMVASLTDRDSPLETGSVSRQALPGGRKSQDRCRVKTGGDAPPRAGGGGGQLLFLRWGRSDRRAGGDHCPPPPPPAGTQACS